MKIGITGGTGRIGSHVIETYANTYFFSVITSQKKCSMFNRFESVSVRNLPYDLDGYCRAFKGCDAVVHLGAKVMHNWDGELSVSKWINNLENDGYVFEACRKLGIKNVIYASSVAVYDNREQVPMSEGMLDHPNSLYGLIKSSGERLAAIYNERYDMKIKCLRISKVIGFYGINYEDKSFWSQVLINSLEKKAIPIYGEGNTARDIIYVKDVARAINCALNKPDISGVFNVGSGIMASNLEIAKAYCDVFDNNAGVKFVEHTKETGLQNRIDCSKAKRELGFLAKYSLWDMLKDIKKDLVTNI